MTATIAVLFALHPMGASVEVNWDPELRADAERTDLVQWVERYAGEAVDGASRFTGVELDRPLKVYVHSADSFQKRYGRSHSDFAWAHYYRGQVHVNGGIPIRRSFVGLLHHEMTHAVLDAKGRSRVLPRWLNEGLAERAEAIAMGRREIDQVQRLYLKDGLRDGELPALESMGAPKNATQYLQCQAAIHFAFQKYGRETVLEAVRDALENGSFEDSWSKATSTTVRRFDTLFRDWIEDFEG
ncbi:MAG: hypothetical protein AAFQ82_17785 [Myxococcota bacterium]